jgi:hypothetical protein
LYRGINNFKKGYQPRTLTVKDDKGDLIADSHSTMAMWRNHYSQLLNVHGVSEVRQAEIHTAEPLVPEASALEFELAIEKLKSHKSPGIDQIPAELSVDKNSSLLHYNRVDSKQLLKYGQNLCLYLLRPSRQLLDKTA